MILSPLSATYKRIQNLRYVSSLELGEYRLSASLSFGASSLGMGMCRMKL